jgi:hypothetical protein
MSNSKTTIRWEQHVKESVTQKKEDWKEMKQEELLIRQS